MDIPLERFDVTDSTMTRARELAARYGDSPFVVLADTQTSGRGRIDGRVWESVPGASLCMTLSIPVDGIPGDAVPLRVGLGLLDALITLDGGARSRLALKWPNDLMGLNRATPAGGQGMGGWRKAGGILCEMTQGRLLAGIGLNLAPEAYPQALSGSATNLAEVIGPAKDRDGSALDDRPSLALQIAGCVMARLGALPWRADYERSMWGMGESVRFMEGHPDSGRLSRGRIMGVDDSGRLLLDLDSGERGAFLSGEISGIRGG